MRIQEELYQILKQEAVMAAQKIAGATLVNDYETLRQWSSYFDECSACALMVKDMSREEFTQFLFWNEWARELLGL